MTTCRRCPRQATLAAFASRRGPDTAGRAPALGAANRPDPAALARAARGKPVEDLPPMPRPPQAASRPPAPSGLRAGMGKGLGALVTAPSLPGSRKAKAKVAAPAPAVTAARTAAAAAGGTPADAAKSLTRPGGTFGARPATAPKSRTILFLSLVAILLLFLALVAAWSSFYLASRNDAASAPTAVAAGGDGTAGDAAIPAVEDEMLADGEDPEAALPDAAAAEDTAALDAAEPALPEADPAVKRPRRPNPRCPRRALLRTTPRRRPCPCSRTRSSLPPPMRRRRRWTRCRCLPPMPPPMPCPRRRCLRRRSGLSMPLMRMVF